MTEKTNEELAKEHCTKIHHRITIGNDDLWAERRSGFLAACEIKDQKIKALQGVINEANKIFNEFVVTYGNMNNLKKDEYEIELFKAFLKLKHFRETQLKRKEIL